jgi:hypothetical protein
MSSVSSIAAASPAASARRLDVSYRDARGGEDASIPVAFTTPRIDRPDRTPSIPEALDIKNIKRANAYADPFGMPVDPTKDIANEGAANLFRRYADEVGNVLDRIYGAKFTALLDVKV